MKVQPRTFVGVILAMSIILVGLFLVCAQQQASRNGDDLSADDEQFRQELLEMLDLAEDLDADPSGQADIQVVNEQSDDDDVYSMVIEDDDSDDDLAVFSGFQEEPKEEQVFDSFAEDSDDDLAVFSAFSEEPEATKPIDTTPKQTAANMGLSSDMFISVKNEVSRLEKVLADKSFTADSLKRVIEARNSRIRELEIRMSGNMVRPVTSTNYSYSPSNDRLPTSVSSEYSMAYRQARSLFESYQYNKSIEAFQTLLNQYPNHELTENCQYWIGECYFGLKQYQQAVMEFQKVFAYSSSTKHDDAQLMIGLSYIRLGQPDRAKPEFETFISNYPSSEYIAIARRYYANS